MAKYSFRQMLHYTLHVSAPVPALLLLGNFSNSLFLYVWFYFIPLCIGKCANMT